jgi:hypothetical protein
MEKIKGRKENMNRKWVRTISPGCMWRLVSAGLIGIRKKVNNIAVAGYTISSYHLLDHDGARCRAHLLFQEIGWNFRNIWQHEIWKSIGWISLEYIESSRFLISNISNTV